MPSQADNTETKRRVVLLTGMSGAGISTALKTFEDLGYESVDNLRLGLIDALLEDQNDPTSNLAIAIDTRNANFTVDDLLAMTEKLEARGDLSTTLLFFECADDTLLKRFTETRRRHPMAADRPAIDGIKREREILWRVRDQADQVIDTSLLSIHDLHRLIAGHYSLDNQQGLTLFITSFSFRHGLPREADMVFDVRFMANPHWDPVLRPLTGKDPDAIAYIRKDPDFTAYMDHVTQLLLLLLPRYQREGKSYLTIAVGCTGGRQRSVLVAEDLATCLAQNGYIVGVGHRDLDRAANKA